MTRTRLARVLLAALILPHQALVPALASAQLKAAPAAAAAGRGAVSARVIVPLYTLPGFKTSLGSPALGVQAAPAAPRPTDDGEFPLGPEPAVLPTPVERVSSHVAEKAVKAARKRGLPDVWDKTMALDVGRGARLMIGRGGDMALELKAEGDRLFDMAPARLAGQLPSVSAALQRALERPAKGKAGLEKAVRSELKRLAAEKRVKAAAGSPIETEIRLEPEMDAVLKGASELVTLAAASGRTAADFKATLGAMLSGYTSAVLSAAGASRSAREGDVVREVTGLYPVTVERVVTPETLEEIVATVKAAPIVSVGGGRFSMGGQTATEGAVQLDMRKYDKVLAYDPAAKEITVQAGIRWRDIQEKVDPDGLSVSIMQSYANFTVGGSLGVNSHGRYMGLGPLILSVKEIKLVLADGSIVVATPEKNSEYFYAAIGGYGGVGVVVEAKLALAENRKLERVVVEMKPEEYPEYFSKQIRDNASVVFHNADIVAPWGRIRAISFVETDKPVTVPDRLQPKGKSYWMDRLMIHLITERPWGNLYRRLSDKLADRGSRVVWRNYEASYDVASLEPASREKSTYVLQEYFIPVGRTMGGFGPKAKEILTRHRVKLLNNSIRHALKDPGSLLAWAPVERFAHVLYYKQGTSPAERGQVAVWTRELIDAAIESDGAYYLPYQPHGRPDQFHAAYKRANEYFAFKKKVDPTNKFRNKLLDAYYEQAEPEAEVPADAGSFARVFGRTRSRDGFFSFLQVVFNLFPEAQFHHMIWEETKKGGGDESVYKRVQARLGEISPRLKMLRYDLPSLWTQKKEMLKETKELLGPDFGKINGYVEVGYPGRHIKDFRKELGVSGQVWVVNETEPGYGPADVAERGGARKTFKFVENHYEPITPEQIPDASADLVTVFIGLHHAPPEKLDAYLASLRRILRPGGRLVIREHDVDSPEMEAMADLAHTVYDAGIGMPWEQHAKDTRNFFSRKSLGALVEKAGFHDTGKSILQANDPSKNTLMEFVRPADVPDAGPRHNFAAVYGAKESRDAFAGFMDVVYGFFPQGKLHGLLAEETAKGGSDEEIYRRTQARLGEITPWTAPVLAIKAAKKQKRELGEQMADLLGRGSVIDGMLEYGSEGLYTKPIQERMTVKGPIYTVDENPPALSPDAIITRGRVRKHGTYLPNMETPIAPEQIPDASLDLVVVNIGLHHLNREKLDEYVKSLWRVLRPGGRMLVRDHDVDSPLMASNAHLAHDVFNLGFKKPWGYNAREYRQFFSADGLAGYLGERGFADHGHRVLQPGDPSRNTLMLFTKTDRPGEPAELGKRNRPASNTYMTLPEWNIVFAAREYAKVITMDLPSRFPYFRTIAEFWREYREAIRHTKGMKVGLDMHGMDLFIGAFHTAEYGVKGLYESTFGRVSELFLKDGTFSKADMEAARIASDYAAFINTKPWYEYDWKRAFREARAVKEERGTRIRGFERKLFMLAEFGAKALWAPVTAKMTGGTAAPEYSQTSVVAEIEEPQLSAFLAETPAAKVLGGVEGGRKALILPRYAAFGPALYMLILKGGVVRKIAGNETVALTALAPAGWAPPKGLASTLHRYPMLTGADTHRVALKAPVNKLHQLLPTLQLQRIRVEHVYDF